jgi:hypothetical protein
VAYPSTASQELLILFGVEVDDIQPVAKRWAANLGLLLAPLAGLVMIGVVGAAVVKIQHYASLPSYPAHNNGITSLGREGHIIYYVVLTLSGPASALFLWLDPLGARINRRSRVSLIGYVSGLIAVMALVATVTAGR